MSFEIQGKMVKVFDVESKSATFQTREFVIETEETYPQFVKFQLTQDRCGLPDGYTPGEKVKVSFDLRGREWQDKYFTNLNAWKMERVAPAAAVSGAPSDVAAGGSFEPFDSPFDEPQDLGDLPF